MKENVALAFGLVIAAGASTALGAAVVFSKSLVQLANKKVLAASLAFSAGVMLFVSFSEIMKKSKDAFVQAGLTSGVAYGLSVACFFGGFVVMKILDVMVHCLDPHHTHDSPPDLVSMVEEAELALEANDGSIAELPTPGCHIAEQEEEGSSVVDISIAVEHVQVHVGARPVERSHSVDMQTLQGSSSKQLKIKGKTEEGENGKQEGVDEVSPVGIPVAGEVQTARGDQEEEEVSSRHRHHTHHHHHHHHRPELKDPPSLSDSTTESSHHPPLDPKLKTMGLNTALAIAVHNFPEGLATFVATLADPVIGASLAVAIALHNIPEGLCVSIPVFYATQNRRKAFLWGILSGVTEPIGALAGYVILINVLTPVAFAVLFGLVAGMMVLISVKELLPTAHRYDPDDRVVTTGTVLGMVMMAASLVLFVI